MTDALPVRRAERVKSKAMALVLEWAALHRHELRADWERARRNPSGVDRTARLRSRHEIGSNSGGKAAGRLPPTSHTDRRPLSRERYRTNAVRSSFCRD